MLKHRCLPSVGAGRRTGLVLVLTLSGWLLFFAAGTAQAEPASPVPDWAKLVQTHQDRLGKVDSDQAALELFVGAVGPALTLNDVAATLGAKGISAKLANELMLPEITKSAQRLVAALTAWQVAERITRALTDGAAQGAGASSAPSPAQAEWLAGKGPFPSLTQASQLLAPPDASGAGTPDSGSRATATAVAANRLAQEAGQQALAEWWRLKTWKDRVRLARGQSRLCGTWQWVIHNHQQHHQEQKLSLLFPPPGSEGTGIPGLTELVVLGDAVYLRWEMEGKMQEDSLLFSKEGQRLEGTFVNSQGGWGSISGKRTASCTAP